MLHFLNMDELEQRERLINVLTSLESLTKRQISLKYVLLRGALYGLGTVIGATVLISVVSYLFLQIFGINLFDTEALRNAGEQLSK